MIRAALALLACLAVTGCASFKRQAPTNLSRPVAEAEILSRVFAAVDQAILDLMEMPPSPTREAVRYNLGVAAAGRLVPSTAKHTADAASLSKAAKEGDTAKAESLAAVAKADLLKQLGAAEKERDNARRALEEERAKHKRELEEAKSSIWRDVQFYGALALYGVAILCLVLAVLRAKAAITSGLDIVAGAKSAATLLGLSATCFSVARFMAAWWFWWGCGGVIVAIIAYMGWLAYRERQGAAAAAALTPIRRALDKAYDQAVDKGTAADMDRTIFQPIAEEMKAVKAPRRYLHLDRANNDKAFAA